jgi:hypothetical protein
MKIFLNFFEKKKKAQNSTFKTFFRKFHFLGNYRFRKKKIFQWNSGTEFHFLVTISNWVITKKNSKIITPLKHLNFFQITKSLKYFNYLIRAIRCPNNNRKVRVYISITIISVTVENFQL